MKKTKASTYEKTKATSQEKDESNFIIERLKQLLKKKTKSPYETE